jgi:hypothetical protein
MSEIIPIRSDSLIDHSAAFVVQIVECHVSKLNQASFQTSQRLKSIEIVLRFIIEYWFERRLPENGIVEEKEMVGRSSKSFF